MPALPKASGERNNVEGETERKSKSVIKETSVNSTFKESKTTSYFLIMLYVLLARLNDLLNFV